MYLRTAGPKTVIFLIMMKIDYTVYLLGFSIISLFYCYCTDQCFYNAAANSNNWDVLVGVPFLLLIQGF